MIKSLEYEDEKFEQFIDSQECIFQFTGLHYPNQNQQKLINSYFQVKCIISEYSTANQISKQIQVTIA